jgi:redox-sensitive bicupin YhaK (pirin superfamily)
MGGIFLDQALPIYDIEQIDPFLLIHHWDRPLKGKQHQKETGVGPHPHRGFSPVTIIFKGAVHHRDSRNNNSVVEAGGAQWMNSGMGIIHSERPTKELAEKGGDFEIIQFWVNVPAKYKMEQPEYFPIKNSDMPSIGSEDKNIDLRLLAGNYQGVTGPIKGKSKLLIFIIEAKEGGKISMNIPERFSGLLYQLSGKLLLNNSFSLGNKQMAWFKNNGDEILIECKESSRAVLLAGEPIGEEVTASGPFVMNTHSEILKAMRDYQMGKMGILVEDFT